MERFVRAVRELVRNGARWSYRTEDGRCVPEREQAAGSGRRPEQVPGRSRGEGLEPVAGAEPAGAVAALVG